MPAVVYEPPPLDSLDFTFRPYEPPPLDRLDFLFGSAESAPGDSKRLSRRRVAVRLAPRKTTSRIVET